jgi:putative transposase
MGQGLKIDKRTRDRLKAMLGNQTPARVAKRAMIVLALGDGDSIASAAKRAWCGTATVKGIKKRFLEEGWKAAIEERPRAGARMKTTPEERARLVALACSEPPEGHPRWTYKLLWKHWETKEKVSVDTVRLLLLADGLKPWREKNVVCPKDRQKLRGPHARPPSTLPSFA